MSVKVAGPKVYVGIRKVAIGEFFPRVTYGDIYLKKIYFKSIFLLSMWRTVGSEEAFAIADYLTE